MLVMLLLLLRHLACVSALTLSALTPNVYWPGEQLPLSVNKVYSNVKQETFSYYDLPFVCQPSDGYHKAALTLSEILRGDRTLESDFDIEMLSSQSCRHLCTVNLDAGAIQQADRMIKDDYRADWYIDELPGATAITTHDKTQKYYISGFPIGKSTSGTTYLYNHFNLVIKWRHSDNHDETRIILAFEIYPRSIESPAHHVNRYATVCAIPDLADPDAPLAVDLRDAGKLKTSMNFTYTYSVYFREDLSIHWIDRWNLYFAFTEAKVVWYTTLLSGAICLAMSVVVGLIFVRTLRREMQVVSSSFKIDLELDPMKGSGWKHLKDDVFRRPGYGNMLTAFVGSGVQLIVSAAILTLLNFVGLAKNNGQLTSIAVFLFAFVGEFSGYFSSRIYKSFHGEHWLHTAFLTALVLPLTSIAILLLVDMFAYLSGSRVALSPSTLFELVVTWGGISLPLVFVGSYIGHRAERLEYPGRIASIPRQIPRQPFYTQFWPSLAISGFLPYAVICTECVFILKSFELHQDGYLFFVLGSFLLVLFISVVTTTEVTLTMIYLQLQTEDHQWWWRAFLHGSSSAAYLFVHATVYFFYKLRYGFVSGIIYFGYLTLFCMVYAVFQGTLSFLATMAFVRRIYGALQTH